VDTNLFIGPANSYIVPEPFGLTLVMSAWNYPLYTAIPPVAQAIAAGNCVILKPSELASKTS
jgi:aldehyde dehydrogenase (NAD+)